ncbi:MAG TPA: DUF6491 family protein [Rhodanobacteraceae bacterium]|nr:DUF6491 family protein [Rhodanobacteraceae bacterium]
MRLSKWIPLLLLAALAGCAQQPTRDAPARRASAAVDYDKYVQRDVPWFRFTSLYSWDSNRLGSVVVWTGPAQAYLLSLAGSCIGLQNTFMIALTSQDGLVDSNRDYVIAGGDRCQIIRIQTIDAKAIRALRGKAKAGSDKGG